METLTVLFILLAASFMLGRLLKRIRLPQVMGPIAVGIITGTFFSEYVNGQQEQLLQSFADLGLVFLMFYVGLELDIVNSFRRPTRIILVSVADILVPFAITFIVMKLMGFGTLVSVILGVIMSITAEAVSIDILKELGILRSRLGQTIVLIATLDDVVGIVFLSGLVTFIEKGDQALTVVVFNILIFFTLIYAVRFILIPYVLRFATEAKSQLFIAGLLMVLLVSIMSDALGFGELIGALLAGIVIRYTMLDKDEFKEQKDMTELFEAVTFGFLAPFFFIWIGLNTDFSIIANAPSLGLLLTALAVLTKILGSLVGYFLAHQTFKEGFVMGTAMMNKGVVELILAEVARRNELIGIDLFSSIVFMAIMTTIISPISFSYLVKKLNIS